MQSNHFTKPIYIFFLTLTPGISTGFVSVALPYLLVHNGFSVAQAASMIAIGLSANLWRFVWGPIVDISLSLKKWFWIGLLLCTSSLLLLTTLSYDVKNISFLTIIIFISQVAATFMLLPINGIMAKLIEDNKKGKASGLYQAGSLVGTGFGGGVGLWLSNHYSITIAGIILCVCSVLFSLVIIFIKDVAYEKGKNILNEITTISKDVWQTIKVPVSIFAILLIMMPIGTGAAANLWSAIAIEWNTNADIVALVTGVLSGFTSAIGCVVGGFIIDKYGKWTAYLGSGSLCAFVTFLMAIMPKEPYVYIAGVLVYTFGIGLINAAFTAVILYVVGKKNVATKFSLLASLGNLPVIYMTAFDGWTHDKFNSKNMLIIESLLGVFFVLIFFISLKRMKHKNLIPEVVDL